MLTKRSGLSRRREECAKALEGSFQLSKNFACRLDSGLDIGFGVGGRDKARLIGGGGKIDALLKHAVKELFEALLIAAGGAGEIGDFVRIGEE